MGAHRILELQQEFERNQDDGPRAGESFEDFLGRQIRLLYSMASEQAYYFLMNDATPGGR